MEAPTADDSAVLADAFEPKIGQDASTRALTSRRDRSELRLFISSTFIDFQEERDFLAKKVFPAFRRRCRERGIEFTEIDLRWGLTDEDSEQGRILEACFEEIDNCRPFFIGLLGERYGWVPPIDELEKNPDLRTDHPWLEEAIRNGQSATELEFRHGFLNGEHSDTSPLIYFRSGFSQEDSRVTKLKQEVSSHLGIVPEFHTPSELASLIERDITSLIERYWPSSQKQSWLDQERAGHSAFAQSRRKGYVANPSIIDQLDAFLDDPGHLLVLTGESGSGKSSLLSYWAESQRARKPNSFIIEHFIGVTAASTDSHSLMRRIIEEIRERIHTDDPIPQSATELERSFPSWLGRVSGEPLLILVDAINQLNTEGRFLNWLPEYVSSNVKWVISSTKSEALERLRERGRGSGSGWPEIEVLPITLDERKRVLRTFLAGFQKKLHPKQEEKIIHDQKSSSPLFLRTLLEELRLEGKHEDLDELIDHYLHSLDTPDLFKRILERLEQDYGRHEVQILLTRIWSAPYGLSESEIIESSDLDRISLSHLLHAFDYHLVRLKGRLSFFHDHLRLAVEGRYLDSSDEKRSAWLQLASYFQNAEASSFKALSLPWLWHRAERWESLRHSLLELDLLPFLTDGSRSYDLLSYWLSLERQKELELGLENTDNADSAARAHWIIDVVDAYEVALQKGIIAASEERDLRYSLALFFHNAGWLRGSISNTTRALELSEDIEYSKAEASRLVDLYLELGTAYLDNGDPKRASQWLEKALNLEHEIDPEIDPREIHIRNEYARLLQELGRYAEAEDIVRKTLKDATERYGPTDGSVLHAMRLLADILAFEAKYQEAESLYRKVLKGIEASLGPESLEAGYYLNQLANFIRRFGGNDDEARHLFERAVTIIESRLGGKHPDLAILIGNLASLHSQHRRWEQAEPLFLRTLSINEVAHGPEHPITALSLNNYAALLYRQGRFDEAEAPYRRALSIQRKVLGEDHPVTSSSLHNLGNLLRQQQRYVEAEACYTKALEIRLATLGPNHADTGLTLESFGRLKRLLVDLSAAEDYFARSYAARIASLGPTNNFTITVGIELAEVLVEKSKIAEAQAILANLKSATLSNENFGEDIQKRLDTLIHQISEHVGP